MRQHKFSQTMAAGMVCLAALGYSRTTWAIDVLPGDILPLPEGSSAMALYYQYGRSDAYNASGWEFKENARLDTQIGVARILHSFTLAGLRAQANAVLPFGSIRNGEIGGTRLNTSTGLGDATVSLQLWPLSDPERGSYIGISGLVTAPTGRYKDGDPVNIGENRWSGTVLLAGSQRLAPGWSLEGYLDWHSYGKNNKAGPKGNQTLAQQDSYEGQFYLVHNFGPATTGSIGYSFYSGGSVSIDGVENGVRIQKQQLRAAINQFLSPRSLLTLQVSHDYAVRGGFRQNIAVTLRAAYLF